MERDSRKLKRSSKPGLFQPTFLGLVKNNIWGEDASHNALTCSLASWRNLAFTFQEEPPGELLLRLRRGEPGWWSEKEESPSTL